MAPGRGVVEREQTERHELRRAGHRGSSACTLAAGGGPGGGLLMAQRAPPTTEPKVRELAERVGFVPVDDPSFNNLGLISIGKNSKNTQKPRSRYKTGTVNCGWETHPRGASSRLGCRRRPVARSRPSERGSSEPAHRSSFNSTSASPLSRIECWTVTIRPSPNLKTSSRPVKLAPSTGRALMFTELCISVLPSSKLR